MQAFTDLVGTSAAVPAHAFDIAELTDLTPTLDIATADIHGEVVEARPAATFTATCDTWCHG